MPAELLDIFLKKKERCKMLSVYLKPVNHVRPLWESGSMEGLHDEFEGNPETLNLTSAGDADPERRTWPFPAHPAAIQTRPAGSLLLCPETGLPLETSVNND